MTELLQSSDSLQGALEHIPQSLTQLLETYRMAVDQMTVQLIAYQEEITALVSASSLVIVDI